MLLTRIRVGRSELNQHKFSIGHSDSPQCLCHYREESPLHYFLDCFLYSPERQILLSKIEHHIPHFYNFSKKRQLDIILRGYYPERDEFISLNTSLTYAVQNYIVHTKRFSQFPHLSEYCLTKCPVHSHFLSFLNCIIFILIS